MGGGGQERMRGGWEKKGLKLVYADGLSSDWGCLHSLRAKSMSRPCSLIIW